MPGTKELTRRIKSIKSTRKITRAMQMVSAAKMRKAQTATLSSRTYAELAREMISILFADHLPPHPLLRVNSEAQKIGVVLISTNRGLVGSFNLNLLGKLKAVQLEYAEVMFGLVVLGKKAREGASRMGQNIVAEFPKFDTPAPITEIYPLAKLITESYTKGEYREIYLIYNHFVSTLTQKPVAQQLLPFGSPPYQGGVNHPRKSEAFLGDPVRGGLSKETPPLAPPYQGGEEESAYLFEPSPQAVLDHLLPRIIESQIYQAILESDASEHSARMIMMKNATDAAGDLIDDLTLTYNQLRQNKITTELSEITAGKIALENK